MVQYSKSIVSCVASVFLKLKNKKTIVYLSKINAINRVTIFCRVRKYVCVSFNPKFLVMTYLKIKLIAYNNCYI